MFFTASAPLPIGSPVAAADTSLGNAHITLGSYSGPANTTVSVSGGGYAVGSEVAVFVGTGTTAPAGAPRGKVVAGDVAFTTYFGPVAVPLPAVAPAGPVTITAVGIGGATDGVVSTASYYVQALSPTIEVVSGNSVPGTPITVSGVGFAPNESVAISFAGTTATATANALGAFQAITMTVPKVKAGSYTIDAVGSASKAKSTTYFYISDFFTSASPSASYLLPGGKVSFSGGGFMAGETVVVTDADGKTLSTFVVPATGNFANLGEITVPIAWSGTTQEFTINGKSTNKPVVVTISVGQYFPNISASQYYVNPGKSIDFNGWSFAPGEIVDAYVGASTVPAYSIPTNIDGVFLNGAKYTAPFNATGSETFRFVGRQSAGIATISITIGQLLPQVQPGEYFLKAGKPTSASASGFAAGEPVTLSFPGVKVTAIADIDGVALFPAFAVPFGSDESVTYTAIGGLSGAIGKATVNIGSYMPQGNSSTYYALPGTPLALAGWEFAPNEIVELKQDGKTVATFVADETGTVKVPPFAIAFGSTGALNYSLSGTSSKGAVPISLTVGSYSPSISAGSYYVKPGGQINVYGGGFAPNEPVTVRAGSQVVNAVADINGFVPATAVTMPFLSPDEESLTVTVTGTLSNASSFVVIKPEPFAPTITPTTYFATPGSPVVFYGSGFANKETVTIKSGTTTLGTVTTDAFGSFETPSYALPYGSKSVTYSFTGSQSGATVTQAISLSEFNAQISLGAYYALPGTANAVNGSGFAPGEEVAVTFANAALGTAKVDAFGSFALAFTVPAGTGGEKAVVATGKTSGAKASTSFSMAEPVPVIAN